MKDDLVRLNKDTGRVTSLVCPLCGNLLLTDGKQLWCSFVGNDKKSQPACWYGVSSDVKLSDSTEKIKS